MYYLGIDLGGTNITAGIVDKNFSMVAKGMCQPEGKGNIPILSGIWPTFQKTYN